MGLLGQFKPFIFLTKIFRTRKHKDTQTEAKNANKQISDFFSLKCFLRAFFLFVRCTRFVLFALVKFFNKEV